MDINDFIPAARKYAAEARRINQTLRRNYSHEELESIALEFAWRGLEEYEEGRNAKLTTYVIQRIRWGMMQTARDTMAQEKRASGYSLTDEEGNYIVEPSYEQSHDIDAEDEVYTLLDKASLTPNQRTAILLYLEGLTFQKIGERMGMTFEGARYNYHNGIKQLKQSQQG